MINIERILQWNIALIVFFGALLLGLGNGQYYLPLMAGGAALFSLIFVDKLQWFVLNRFAANIVALFVAVLPLLNFFDNNNEAQLLSIARLLIHLQIVLLLEKKTSRIYWQLFVLSVLQVVVAAALRLDLQGGLIFGIYVLLDFSGMVLMLLHRDSDRVSQANVEAQRKEKDAREMLASENPARILRAAPIASFTRKFPASQFLGSYLRTSLILTVMAVTFATFLFYSVQRTGDAWYGARLTKISLVGFSDSITFDEDGLITESGAPVMRVRLSDPVSEEPIELNSELYLRGMTLHFYGKKDGVMSWEVSGRGSQNRSVRSDELNLLPEDYVDYIRQEISLEPTGEPYMFTQFPALTFSIRDRNRMEFDPIRNILKMTSEPQGTDDLRYELAVLGIREKVQSRTYPYENPFTSSRRSMLPGQKTELTGLPSELMYRSRMSYISDLADRWASETLDPNDHLLVAREFENRLRRSGEFRYTLDFRNVKRDKDLDPIVDFLKNHKSGHCEYFGSALALLLRSRNIPARLVVGYRGGEFNDIGNFYEIQQQHAHVWVEAYLGPDQVTPEMIDRGEAGPGGAWLRLDPTPAASDALEDQESDESLLNRADDAFGFAQMLWDDFVVGLNAERQNKTLFGGSVGNLLEGSYWQNLISSTAQRIPVVRRNPQLSFQIMLGVFAVIVVAMYLAPRRKSRRKQSHDKDRPSTWLQRLSPRLARLLGQGSGQTSHPRVDFYERLEATLHRQGYDRAQAQTALEFTSSVTKRLADHPNSAELTTAMETIVQAFYEVRFAEQPLSDSRRQSVIQAIDQVERELIGV